jgi:uncharacterized protein (TIGR02147 family)
LENRLAEPRADGNLNVVSAERSPKRHRAPVDVFKYRDYREFLAAFYVHKKAGGMSYRGFSRAAGLGAPNYLKLVIEGKRNLSSEMAERFARACRLNEDGTEYFRTLVAFNQATTDDERNALHERLTRFARFRASQRLDLAEKEYHSTWYIPAVRELVACPSFVESPSWIAQSLDPEITEQEASHALAVLLQLGMLERDERDQLTQATRAVSTGQQASGLYIRNYHAQMMQRATLAMEHFAAEERYISALTLSASEATLAEVQKRVIEFRKEIAALCDADPRPSRIVQLNFQFFPLTRRLPEPAERAKTRSRSMPESAKAPTLHVVKEPSS